MTAETILARRVEALWGLADLCLAPIRSAVQWDVGACAENKVYAGIVPTIEQHLPVRRAFSRWVDRV